MTDEINREALALWNAERARKGFRFLTLSQAIAAGIVRWPALRRAVELLHAERAAHEVTKAEFAQFRQEVDFMARDLMRCLEPIGQKIGYHMTHGMSVVLDRFILLPPPDPITEWLHKSGYEGNPDVESAVRAYAEEAKR